MTLKNNRTPLLYYVKPCALFQSHGWIPVRATVWKSWIRVKISDFYVPRDLEIWWMTLKNNRAPLIYYIKLCASFRSHLVSSNLSYSPETLDSGQNRWFFVHCDLGIWQMTLKTNRAPFLCLMHHFIAISVFKLELQSGNDQFGSKTTICVVALSRNFTDDLEKQ